MGKRLLKRFAVMLGIAAVCATLACFVPVRHVRVPDNGDLMVDILVHRGDEASHTTLYGQDRAKVLELIRQADLRYTPPGMDAQTFSLDLSPYIVVMINARDAGEISYMVTIGKAMQGDMQARLKPRRGMQYTVLDPAPLIHTVTALTERSGLSV